jgi:hypothetical protein
MARAHDGGAIVHVGRATADVLAGEVDLSDWDDEELVKGRRKDKNGRFTGRPPKLLPAAYFQELTKRRFARAYQLLEGSLIDGARFLASIIRNEDAPNADRLRATELLFDRILGRPKERVGLSIEEPNKFQRLLMAAIVGTEEQVIDGEIIEGD